MNRLLLLDGNALLHRAYHALPPLTSPDGKPTGAVYGFLSMVVRLKTDLHPTHYAAAFDRPAPTFRNELFTDYQSQRPPMDDDLVGQVGLIHEALNKCGISIFEMDGFEADDVIGTIVKKVMSQSSNIDQIIIVTGDRDILQLVEDEKVLVYMPIKGLTEAKLYGEKEVIERLSVPPKEVPDWKALAGDSSDNYPGVPGLGPKTAAHLVTTYHTIENLYAALKNGSTDISEGVKEKLRVGEASAILSKQLATIRTDAPIQLELSSLQLDSFDREGTREYLGSLGFHSLVKRVMGETVVKEKTKEKEKKSSEKSAQQTLF